LKYDARNYEPKKKLALQCLISATLEMTNKTYSVGFYMHTDSRTDSRCNGHSV
jgi:hypothetical protein